MKNFINKISGFVGNEEGQGLLEYALIITLIAVVVIIALQVFGRKISNVYDNSTNAF
jgi:pilus assembly protein Flp/PilA